MDKHIDRLQRRELIHRTVKAGLSIAAAGAISTWLYNRKEPDTHDQNQETTGLPDFSVSYQPGTSISIVTGTDRKRAVCKAIELLGGMERFIKPGETVVIKPNVAFASPPTLGATTNPQLVAEVTRLCYASGAKRVRVTDNPINDPPSCFTLSGIAKAASQASADLILPKANLFKPITVTNGRLIRNWPVFVGPLEKSDKLIGIAPVKNHHRSGASMSMKNFYGLLGGRRNIFHQDINTIIAELALMVKPTLVILDGIEVMATNGPTGGSTSDLKPKNTLIASCDMVAADSFGCSLLGLRVCDLPYLAKAQKAGAGTTDYQSLRPVTAQAD